MPLYEYQCDSCQKVHEVMQKFSDAPLSECPECKSPVKKLMSMTSFSLKGTGWYTTDYKRSSASTATSSSGAKTAESSAADKSSESGKGGGCGSGCSHTSH